MTVINDRERKIEREKLDRLIGATVVAIDDDESDEHTSPVIVLERNGEVFREKYDLFKFHMFEGGRLMGSYFGVEEVS